MRDYTDKIQEIENVYKKYVEEKEDIQGASPILGVPSTRTNPDNDMVVLASGCKYAHNILPNILEGNDKDIDDWQTKFKDLAEEVLDEVENGPKWESLKGNPQIDVGIFSGTMRMATDEEVEAYNKQLAEETEKRMEKAYGNRITTRDQLSDEEKSEVAGLSV